MWISIAEAAETAGAHAEAGGFFDNPENWVAITWLIVVAALARPVGRGLVKALDGRRDKIRDRLAEAEKLRDDAQEALARYQKKQREALGEAEAIVAQAKAEAARLTQEAAVSLDELVKRRELQAIDRINQAEAEAMAEVRNKAVELAMEATRRLIAEHLPVEKATALVDAAIKDLPSRLH